jgi:plasmid replication initiation protein
MKEREKIMKNLLVKFLRYLTKNEEQKAIYQPGPQEEKPLIVESKQETQVTPKESDQPEAQIPTIQVEEAEKKLAKKTKKKALATLTKLSIDPRDIMETMGIPYLALSKNRIAPIIYESPDGTTKVKISCHSEHYIASIYDWDIIQCIAGKIQEVINSKEDIPPRTVIIPRYKLLKELNKHDGKKGRKEIEASLSRLKVTGIETTVRNEDFRYKGGFGFIDSWGYTERKDIKEFRITLSDWLYDGICRDGALLKVHPEYFKMTSGLKKILYRIARKHVGTQNKSWDFSIEELHKKSGSERDLRKFKHDLKKVISGNDIPGYLFELIEEDGKITVHVVNVRKYFKEALTQPTLPGLTQFND